jgi:hypothetical protein
MCSACECTLTDYHWKWWWAGLLVTVHQQQAKNLLLWNMKSHQLHCTRLLVLFPINHPYFLPVQSGDCRTVNCLALHPHTCLLATGGRP